MTSIKDVYVDIYGGIGLQIDLTMSIVPWKLDIQRRKLIYVHETHIAIYFQSRFHPRNKDTQATVLICLLIIQNKILPISNKNFVVSCLKELKGISMQSQKLPIAKQNGIEFCDNGLPSLFQMETFLLQNSSTFVESFSWNSIHNSHQLEFIL